ncbi:hypothetical protein WUBG_14917, partial [Wuchereria bancrofti]
VNLQSVTLHLGRAMINVKSSLLEDGKVVIMDENKLDIKIDANEQQSKESFADFCKSIHFIKKLKFKKIHVVMIKIFHHKITKHLTDRN